MMSPFDEFRGNPPAEAREIADFEEDSGLRLPSEYISFLRIYNGGEGFIGANQYVIFWKLSDLLSLNSAYEVQEYAPGLLIFGSNGGGDAFAFDYRDSCISVVSFPFVGMSYDLIHKVGNSFDEFLTALSEVK